MLFWRTLPCSVLRSQAYACDDDDTKPRAVCFVTISDAEIFTTLNLFEETYFKHHHKTHTTHTLTHVYLHSSHTVTFFRSGEEKRVENEKKKGIISKLNVKSIFLCLMVSVRFCDCLRIMC